MTVKPFRADGGDISTDRLREIADNPYGDEEKCWLAKRVLTLLDELEAREVKLPERYEIEMQPLPAPNGEWYSRDDVLLSLASAGIRICRGV
ncbi:hypothetical protein [Enterobacter cloacae]|uniref:hypothetical protein n=1 Tax=Enterobacter cloacae TaxID=550 RepID=UPI002B207601|nr:hypothetical protein [Enterobacter cloacae]MEA5212827.1 hypothetical protein [Enterobacter cloacae]